MGKSAPSPPPAPDPVAIANAQAAANKEAVQESARVNAVDITNPFGTLRFRKDETGLPLERIEALNPTAQGTFNTQQEISSQLTGIAQRQAGFIPTDRFSLDNINVPPPGQRFGNQQFPQQLPQFSRGGGKLGIPLPALGPQPSQQQQQQQQQATGFNAGFSDDALRVEQTQFDRTLGLLNPGFTQQRDRLDQQLANRGLPLGSEAFVEEQNRLDRSQNEARLAASQDAVLAGRAEQSRLFGLEQSQRNQQAQERGTAISESLLERNQPFNELAAFLQGSPALQTPQFQPSPQFGIAPPDILGANALQQNSLNRQFAAQSQSASAFNQGLLGLGGALGAAGIGAFSSKSFKTDKRPVSVLEGVRNLDVQKWRYRPEVVADESEHIGPYAEDFQREFSIGDGVTIDMMDAVGVALGAIKELAEKVDAAPDLAIGGTD